MANIRPKLMQKLMCKREPDTVFAQFRHHVGKHERREVLELVDIDEEWSSFGLRSFGSAESGKTKGGHDQSAQK
jgi:hypothetical protein